MRKYLIAATAGAIIGFFLLVISDGFWWVASAPTTTTPSAVPSVSPAASRDQYLYVLGNAIAREFHSKLNVESYRKVNYLYDKARWLSFWQTVVQNFCEYVMTAMASSVALTMVWTQFRKQASKRLNWKVNCAGATVVGGGTSLMLVTLGYLALMIASYVLEVGTGDIDQASWHLSMRRFVSDAIFFGCIFAPAGASIGYLFASERSNRMTAAKTP